MSDMLEQRLIALAERLDVRADDQLVIDVLARLGHQPARLERRPARRALLAGAVCVAAAIVVVLLVPGPRHSIANWFGLGSTRIEAPTTAPSTVDLGTTIAPTATFPKSLGFGKPTTAGDAAARTGLPVPLVPSLAPPAGIFVVSPPEVGQIVVVYTPSASLPESPVAGVGAVVSSMPGIIDDGLFLKTQNAATTVETLSFQNAAGHVVHAVWLAGQPHDYVFQDRDGVPVFDTLRLATNTLLWQDGDVTYRLEASVTRNRAVELAATVGSP